uniref:Uncharacterized protein n=1 Tax=Anopheles minimus TaxID=112268 RepID=A0A182WPA6_9DIPT
MRVSYRKWQLRWKEKIFLRSAGVRTSILSICWPGKAYW